MKQTKKFAFHLIQEGDSWSVEIIRRVTAKKTRVSKRQNGFASQQEAEQWGQSEVETFIRNMNLNAQKKRRAKNNEQDEDII